MSVYCPIVEKKVTYQFCQDCENPICKEQTKLVPVKLLVRLLVVGSRNFEDYDLLSRELQKEIQELKQQISGT